MTHPRLRLAGLIIVLAACLVLLVSTFIEWRTPAWGILIWGHRTDVFLGALGLALLGSSLIAIGFEGRRRAWALVSRILLATSAMAFVLSVCELYLRHPSRVHLRVAPEVLRAEQRMVEAGVGLRHRWRAGMHHAEFPICNIPLTKQDPDLIASEHTDVTYYTDGRGFTNRFVPQSADVIVIGDSFTQAADVPWDQRWVRILEDSTGLSVYNISQGGYCPTQEVELYARYGDISAVRLVLLGIYGINDIGDERSFNAFVESGMDPREWALDMARGYFPRLTFGFVQVVDRWRARSFRAKNNDDQLDPITVTNTQPSTIVSYYPNYQVRAWECVYLEPRQSLGVRSIEAAIARLATLCRTQGRKAGVLYFPIKQTIHPPDPDDQEPWVEFQRRTLPWIREEGWSREKIVMAGRLLLQGDRRLEAHLASVCDSLGVLFHSTIPALEREVETSRSLTYYRFDTHWNTRGNEAVGRDVAAWVDSIWEG